MSWKAEEKRKDLQWEIERLKGLKTHQEAIQKKKEEQRLGCAVVVIQIKEREITRLQEKELIEMEGQ